METVAFTSESGEGKRPASLTRKLARAAAVVLFIVALIVTPPLLNVSRLQRRIAASMSQSLGRPVRIDSLSLHLLPVPGFTLQGLVVSEDPAFGSEPAIRANKVDVTLRPSSLWRRRVEIATIRFEVDDNGSGPNVNLVRNAQGRWNMEALLMHAAQVDTAPTEQRKPGPEPRFPYIEATGGRINVKLAEEKMPFSLTDADFALWLPSPQQWHVRLEGRPVRTDTSTSDTGVIRLEGTLERAATMAEVPVDLQASWHDAPLGEASKVITGNDADWRGTLHVDAALTGKLGAAKLTTTVTLNDLRRADFIPATLMDVSADCSGVLNTTTAVLSSPNCTMPAPCGPGVSAVADQIDLTHPASTSARIGTPDVSERWLLSWAGLFSDKISVKDGCGGLMRGSVVYMSGSNDPKAWQGQLEGQVGEIAGLPSNGTTGASSFVIAGAGDGFVLQPVNLMPLGKTPPLMLSGSINRQGYLLNLNGTATEPQLRALELLAPPLGDGLDKEMPALFIDGTKPAKVDVTCARQWGGMENCVGPPPVVETKPTRGRGHH
jgi:hypothetical protein